MEEADRILIRSLRLCGAELPDELQSLREFSTEMIVEAVVRCLRVIDPSLVSGISHMLPPGMSARFRIGMSLAQACQELGFQGEVGYQTFLYSSEPDIRQLLMFLAEKLPRDSSEDTDQPIGKSRALQRAIAAKIREQLLLPWVPPSCRTARLQRMQGSCLMRHFHTQRLMLPEKCLSSDAVSSDVRDFYENYLPPVTAQVFQRAELAASLLERSLADVSSVQEREAEWKSQGLASRLSHEDYWQRKHQRLQKRVQEQLRQCSQCPTDSQFSAGASGDHIDSLKSFGSRGKQEQGKGSQCTRTEKFTFRPELVSSAGLMAVAVESLPSSRKLDQDNRTQQEEEVTSLQQQLEQLSMQIDEAGAEVKKLNLGLMQIEDARKQSELHVAENEDVMKVKRQTVALLSDAENNLSKLQLVVESSTKRIVHLASQWEKHRVPLVEQYRELKKLHQSRELESSRRLSDIKEVHKQIRTAAEEAKRKEVLYKQLLTDHESLPKDVSRAAYTQRILEIVGNIKKQKEEITKILLDTKELQKEINNLTGKLDRTFAVTDELVYKDAKRDEAVRKAYKYLAALHENCSQLIETIEDTGTIMRGIRDLEEQIETEAGKRTLSNLEKILEDYKCIKQENMTLLSHIKEA
uniref:Coiled-coil domain-containing protein 22 n=1 Tax=Geotrypetes seraphini TaxID=260995 RepID=A0A6P8P958_GEOSA|nr:coiled-coil domain-containing protein 22 isoform X1 [Geotrypetes seraphini]